jgi:hypothetical protein
MRRCIIVSSLFRTFPKSRRQVWNLNAGKAYLVESVFFATSRITGIEPPLQLAGGWGMFEILRSSHFLGVGFGLPLSLIRRYLYAKDPSFSWCAGAHFRFPQPIQGGVMNRDLPPAVFSSYHWTSFERSDLIGSHQAGRRGRKGWVIREQQRERARSPPSPSSSRLFVLPASGRCGTLFFFIKRWIDRAMIHSGIL